MRRLFYGAVVALLAAQFIVAAAELTYAEIDINSLSYLSPPPRFSVAPFGVEEWRYRAKKSPTSVKAIYLTAYSAARPAKRQEIIELIKSTELNAVVIDTKDYSGKILYPTELALPKQLGAVDNRLPDLTQIISDFHEAGAYVIARQTVFQDPFLAEKKPDWALKNKHGGLWRDHKGLSWVDPANQEVWHYNIEIAKESIKLGFDEINFDYVRFPTDGNMSAVVYTNGDRELHEVMGDFFEFIGTELADYPAYTSLDFFGFVMERHDGISIGQRLEDAREHVDFIYPMMYPSHYPAGHLGLINPAAFPGMVIDNGMKKGLPHVEGYRARIRPWLQAFNIGAVYDGAKMRAQIEAVEKYSPDGWLLWNAANRYSSDGLLSEKSL